MLKRIRRVPSRFLTAPGLRQEAQEALLRGSPVRAWYIAMGGMPKAVQVLWVQDRQAVAIGWGNSMLWWNAPSPNEALQRVENILCNAVGVGFHFARG